MGEGRSYVADPRVKNVQADIQADQSVCLSNIDGVRERRSRGEGNSRITAEKVGAGGSKAVDRRDCLATGIARPDAPVVGC